MPSEVNWDDKTVEFQVCSVQFPGIKINMPPQDGRFPTEADFDAGSLTFYVEEELSGAGPGRVGTIEFEVARDYRDIFCSASARSGGIADLESIVGFLNWWRDNGAYCGDAGAPHLVWDDRLADAGRAHSLDMAENGFFAHTGSDGSLVGDRVRRQAYLWEWVGENIAQGYNQISHVVDAWIASPGHCANILDPRFTEVGVGVAEDGNGKKYWTLVFGKPADAEVFDTDRQDCCVANSIWWERESRRRDDGVYVLEDNPVLYVSVPSFCQWMFTVIRTYIYDNLIEENYLTIRSLEGYGGGGFNVGNQITQNKIVPGMGLSQCDYFEVGGPQPVEIESCTTTYCTCCITGGVVIFGAGRYLRVGMANGEEVWARVSDYVEWESGDYVFMTKNEACDGAIDETTDACKDACDVDEEAPSPWNEQNCKYIVIPLRIGDHGA